MEGDGPWRLHGADDGGDPLNVAFVPGTETIELESGQYFS